MLFKFMRKHDRKTRSQTDNLKLGVHLRIILVLLKDEGNNHNFAQKSFFIVVYFIQTVVVWFTSVSTTIGSAGHPQDDFIINGA